MLFLLLPLFCPISSTTVPESELPAPLASPSVLSSSVWLSLLVSSPSSCSSSLSDCGGIGDEIGDGFIIKSSFFG